MAVTLLNIIPRKLAEAVQTSQYTADGARAVIDKFTVTNVGATPEQFSVNLVASGGTAGNNNLVIDARTIDVGETYSCPELVGQSLENGGFISTIASAANSLTISATGREITA